MCGLFAQKGQNGCFTVEIVNDDVGVKVYTGYCTRGSKSRSASSRPCSI
jgi:hypothetical protein